jgi:hypothetical protein
MLKDDEWCKVFPSGAKKVFATKQPQQMDFLFSLRSALSSSASEDTAMPSGGRSESTITGLSFSGS